MTVRRIRRRSTVAPRLVRRVDATIEPESPVPEAVFDHATSRVGAPSIQRAFLVMPGGSRTGEGA